MIRKDKDLIESFASLNYIQANYDGLRAGLSRPIINPREIAGASRGMPSHEGRGSEVDQSYLVTDTSLLARSPSIKPFSIKCWSCIFKSPAFSSAFPFPVVPGKTSCSRYQMSSVLILIPHARENYRPTKPAISLFTQGIIYAGRVASVS
ncbi:hypothetical protein BO83DRAFT_19096 [Aspergillus eucalypticola CBS 122712]|uniref:Uncharacterized protein n=1 Tax=Aspergillus eucalypticola (strain CBS 122712 / IBT 29274) TaxID=1448314 RepID=A0A317VNV7_ASPEC|nr:uncharacterized protein BO83DRAFT_19096 [Aspergillus eucalypticola CBS 122712]PWY74931.1 hypothetical protein BO83DRAFT_19096 [Aspergillus eucalypticola CBS 122712]